MSINASAARITALTRDLETKWNQTKEYWADQKSRDFDQKYMRELLSSVNMATAASQELDKLIARIRKECE